MSILAQIRESSVAKEILGAISERQQDMLTTLIDWSRINSGSKNLAGIEKFTEKVAAYAADLGAEIDYIQLGDTEQVLNDGTVTQQKNGKILRLTKRTGANRRILMTGHLDTVFPEDSAFQDISWQENGNLNGPGVADMKGGILVMLEALKAFEKSPFAKGADWQVLLSPDEETGSLASAPYLMEHAKSAHIGMTYEPALADGTLAGKRKGSGNYSVVVRGKSAHAGRSFFDGKNAVVHLSSLIGELSKLTGMRPGLTLNPAVVEGGSAPNVVPDLAVLRFNIRLETPEDVEPVEAAIKAIIKKYDEVEGFSVNLYGGINRPPKAISPANERLMDLVKDCGKDLGLDISYVATGGCCEGNNLAAAGLPNVDTLGVRGGLIHSDQEFMVPESLSERARLSAFIMMAFADGALDEVIQAPK